MTLPTFRSIAFSFLLLSGVAAHASTQNLICTDEYRSEFVAKVSYEDGRQYIEVDGYERKDVALKGASGSELSLKFATFSDPMPCRETRDEILICKGPNGAQTIVEVAYEDGNEIITFDGYERKNAALRRNTDRGILLSIVGATDSLECR